MASTCITAGIRLDLEMMKTAGAAAAGGPALPRPAHSAPSSSTLSDAASSSSASSLSLKRPRTPRKRPNQTYNEAAALLASMYPSVFPVARGPETAPPRLLGLASALADDPARSDLLPPFPVLGHAAFLLRDLPHPHTPLTPPSPVPAKTCTSPAAVSSVFSEFRDPAPPSPATPDAAAVDESGELDFDDGGGFHADSFLSVDEGAAEGIDAIMGKLTMDNHAAPATNSYLLSSTIHTHLRNVMMLQLGFRHGHLNKNQAALKGHTDDAKWQVCSAIIPVKDIAPSPQESVQMLGVPENEKSKKKVVGRQMGDVAEQCRKGIADDSANGDPGTLVLPEKGLGLRLNSEEVLKAWCGRGSVFAHCNDPDLPPRASADVLVKHSDSDVIKENVARGNIRREGNILKMQHKQKQCTPVVSNKSRYYRPRVKGRFVSKAYLLQQAAEKEKGG